TPVISTLSLHDALPISSGWGSATIDRRQFLLGAERHSASLPPRLRALVAFHRAFEDGHLAQARRIVQDLIARDPTDVEAWYQLRSEEHTSELQSRRDLV